MAYVTKNAVERMFSNAPGGKGQPVLQIISKLEDRVGFMISDGKHFCEGRLASPTLNQSFEKVKKGCVIHLRKFDIISHIDGIISIHDFIVFDFDGGPIVCGDPFKFSVKSERIENASTDCEAVGELKSRWINK